MNLLNKTTYKAVKRMNRQEMKEHFEEIYKLGFRDGSEVGDKTDFRIKLSKVLNKTKGVGIILHDRIMENAKEME
ncbi:hypothetical protein KQI41_01075 [Tissierella pigra]|uniref:hypothetical protein n=1 Tax=Tissierella pigra TaxID=2607614 RepID=UPI001C0FC6C9|nr:hypothetical protein [Tissierella pigra]MBU5424987.1 hypothetical protein [Tissierella pigra]